MKRNSGEEVGVWERRHITTVFQSSNYLNNIQSEMEHLSLSFL